MLHKVNELQGSTLHALDGDIGHVNEFYFDDEKWTIRYLVVETGGWLAGRSVLLSPIALGEADWHARRLTVNLTREQVKNSPDIGTDKPVSRQQEVGYYQYYGWPNYWGGSGLWGGGMYPGLLMPTSGAAALDERYRDEREQADPDLRSTKEVAGYRIRATDDEIGHVADFLVDDETWAIRYLAVDTGGWWPGKKVLIAPEWITRVSWVESTVDVELKRDTIKNGPEWDAGQPIRREFEERLYGYYHRTPYWRVQEQAHQPLLSR